MEIQRPLDRMTGQRSLQAARESEGPLSAWSHRPLGARWIDALPRAVALELIQTATLIHDDFVDQHEQRRNLPALWTLEGARKAVLLGDVIFASAIQLMSELGREDGLIISNAIAEVSRGAYQEPLDPCSLLDTFERGQGWRSTI